MPLPGSGARRPVAESMTAQKIAVFVRVTAAHGSSKRMMRISLESSRAEALGI
jgi:hypothetical protein